MKLSRMNVAALALTTAALVASPAVRAQNLRVMGTTTSEGAATFNSSATFNGSSALFNGNTTFAGPSTFRGPLTLSGNVSLQASFINPMSVYGDIIMASPDAGIHAVAMSRTNEDGRWHGWYFWHMNRDYVQDSLRIWEYQSDSQGNACIGNPADGAMCAPRLTILKGGNVGIGQDPAYKLDVAGDIHATGWLRTDGTQGWYSQTYGGGWHMTDSTYLRAYNDKWVWTVGVLASQLGLSIGYGGATPPTNGASIAGNVGIGTQVPTQKLHVEGRIRATQGVAIYRVTSTQCACPGVAASGVAVGTLTIDASCSVCKVNMYGGGCSCTYGTVANTPVGRLVDY